MATLRLVNDGQRASTLVVVGLAVLAAFATPAYSLYLYGTVIWIHDHLGDALRLWIAIVARKCFVKWARTHAI